MAVAWMRRSPPLGVKLAPWVRVACCLRPPHVVFVYGVPVGIVYGIRRLYHPTDKNDKNEK